MERRIQERHGRCQLGIKKILMKSKQERFWELFLFDSQYKVDPDKYPNSVFRFRGENFLWEYNSKTGYLWLNHDLIWSVFVEEYQMEYNEIQLFIKNEVEKTFNCKGVTPKIHVLINSRLVEKTFNCKGVTPFV